MSENNNSNDDDDNVPTMLRRLQTQLNDFGAQMSGFGAQMGENLKEELSGVNAKLDRVLDALPPTAATTVAHHHAPEVALAGASAEGGGHNAATWTYGQHGEHAVLVSVAHNLRQVEQLVKGVEKNENDDDGGVQKEDCLAFKLSNAVASDLRAKNLEVTEIGFDAGWCNRQKFRAASLTDDRRKRADFVLLKLRGDLPDDVRSKLVIGSHHRQQQHQ